MSAVSSMFGNLPGQTAVIETYEAAVTWGVASQQIWANGLIAAAAVDTNNSPTWRLRPGLILGQLTSGGNWTNYSATATDGSQIASGILGYGMRMQDVYTGSTTQKFYAIAVGGRAKAANLIGLDNMARAQLASRFVFDDNLAGNADFPWLNFATKTANYQILSTDNFTQFNNLGASGEVDFTLPAIANGYFFGFSGQSDNILKIISTEGSNIIALNNLTASSAAAATGSQKIGANFVIYSNPAATKWILENRSAGAVTVTLA